MLAKRSNSLLSAESVGDKDVGEGEVVVEDSLEGEVSPKRGVMVTPASTDSRSSSVPE